MSFRLIRISVLSGLVAVVAMIALASAAPARAGDLVNGGKLLLTGGVGAVEGEAGGGLSAWALIAGGETADGVGADVQSTYVGTSDFQLTSMGANLGLFNRLELSYAHQAFGTGSTGPKLGLPSGYTFHQDIVGAKLRLFGDAVYDQDRWLPQVSAGLQYKQNDRGGLVRALGARSATGIDYYVSASKLLLAQSLLLNATVRATEANQFGILGFGGNRSSSGYSPQFEGSAAWLASKRLAFGAEFRTKPNNLNFAPERDAYDVFAAFAFNKHLSLTAAYVDLGPIATFPDQRGVYLSLQAGF